MDYPADDEPVINTRPAMWSREVRLDTFDLDVADPVMI
jgi:hypothetical protein